MNLPTPIKQAGRNFKLYASRLEKLGIFTLSDLLLHIPSRYEDFSVISRIDQIQAGEQVTVQGKITELKTQYISRSKNMQRGKVADDTGTIDILWFNQPFLIKNFPVGTKVSLSGRIHEFRGKLSFNSPDYEILENETIHTARLVPIYPETRGVSSKWLRRQIYNLLKENKNELQEFLPSETIKQNDLMLLQDAIEKVHFPDSLEQATNAKYRLSFDELLLLQLAALKRKSEWKQEKQSHIFEIDKHSKQINEFWEKLPFQLTGAQKKAVSEIFKDIATKEPMNRLLEGDVGSGKTVVAAIAMYVAFFNGFQSVLMAPTEILAIQHYQTIYKLLSPFGIKVAIATGSKKENLENFDMLVGTHAILHNRVNFEKLGMIVIDEQHRFGVQQRAILRGKGNSPHLLTMTATPIPRTVALTLYGDLDVSYLNEMPKGRKIIKTWLVPPEKREGAYVWIEKEIKKHQTQAFIICPFIEESESMQTVKAATVEFEKLKTQTFTDLKLGLLHGKLKAKEKDEILEKFRNKEFDILVATPVVEVGIDIPNATIMMIEAADRFGLSGLHQLRGRVGRSDLQSYCLLFTESKSPLTIKRIKSMETIYFGAELAELDLKLRGSGEVYGTMQHGKRMLKITNFSDFDLIQRTKKEAERLFKNLNKFPKLLEKLENVAVKQVAPD